MAVYIVITTHLILMGFFAGEGAPPAPGVAANGSNLLLLLMQSLVLLVLLH